MTDRSLDSLGMFEAADGLAAEIDVPPPRQRTSTAFPTRPTSRRWS